MCQAGRTRRAGMYPTRRRESSKALASASYAPGAPLSAAGASSPIENHLLQLSRRDPRAPKHSIPTGTSSGPASSPVSAAALRQAVAGDWPCSLGLVKERIRYLAPAHRLDPDRATGENQQGVDTGQDDPRREEQYRRDRRDDDRKPSSSIGMSAALLTSTLWSPKTRPWWTIGTRRLTYVCTATELMLTANPVKIETNDAANSSSEGRARSA